MGHLGSKTRPHSPNIETPCLHSMEYWFGPVVLEIGKKRCSDDVELCQVPIWVALGQKLSQDPNMETLCTTLLFVTGRHNNWPSFINDLDLEGLITN